MTRRCAPASTSTAAPTRSTRGRRRWTPAWRSGSCPGPYRIRHYECEAYSVTTNKCPLGPYRGVSRPQACFSIERAMDAVAARARHRSARRPAAQRDPADEYPVRVDHRAVYDSGSTAEALEKILELADHAGLRRQQAEARRRGPAARHRLRALHGADRAHHDRVHQARRADHLRLRLRDACAMDPSGQVLVQVSSHTTARATRRRSRSWWPTSSG